MAFHPTLIGDNLSAAGLSKRKMALINKALGRRKNTGNIFSHPKCVVSKAGVPADNTEDDNPGRAGVLCYDVTNDDVYICTTWASSTSFDWQKISP